MASLNQWWCVTLDLQLSNIFLCVFSLLAPDRSIRLFVPLYLRHEGEEGMEKDEEHPPYRQLSVTITLQVPTVTIHPPQILLNPVPLDTSAVATLTLTAVGYPRLVHTLLPLNMTLTLYTVLNLLNNEPSLNPSPNLNLNLTITLKPVPRRPR